MAHSLRAQATIGLLYGKFYVAWNQPSAGRKEHRRIKLGGRGHRVAAVLLPHVRQVAEEGTRKLMARTDWPSVDVATLAGAPAAGIFSFH